MAILIKVGARVALVGVLVAAVSAYAVTPEQKCQEKKLKAHGKLQLCLQKNAAKMIEGQPDASAKCHLKLEHMIGRAGVCRYLDNGDGTVSDLDTGLMWEKKDTTCPGLHCVSDTFTWCTGVGLSCTSSANPPDGTAFTTFLYGINEGTSQDYTYGTTSGCFAGHCDWRLPLFEELRSISAICPSPPCIDPVFGPTDSNLYWSATTVTGSSDLAYNVKFDGITIAEFGLKDVNEHVRAVRGPLDFLYPNY